MSEQEFIESLKELGITPTKEQQKKLEEYYRLLIEWNQKINLTRIIDKEDVYLKHFYDSLTIVKVVDLNQKENLLDFGTGAGFPGIVLKIFYPNLKITLLDSLQKRIHFLKEVIKELDLKEIEAIHSRVEDYPKKHHDVITTRAVANLSKLLDYTNHLIDSKTEFIALKGHVEEELKASATKLKQYHFHITKKEEFFLPKENSKRTILIIEKSTN